MRRVLAHCALAMLLLGGTMGAAPSHTTTLALPSMPAFLPTPKQETKKFEAPAKPFQVGKASWYGGLFHGKSTASGEDYNMYKLTAAHRELPLGTFVKITNLKNKKAVVVRINDRGPVTPGRVIDLSYAAARFIGMSQKGLEKVRIDIVGPRYTEMAQARQPVIVR